MLLLLSVLRIRHRRDSSRFFFHKLYNKQRRIHTSTHTHCLKLNLGSVLLFSLYAPFYNFFPSIFILRLFFFFFGMWKCHPNVYAIGRKLKYFWVQCTYRLCSDIQIEFRVRMSRMDVIVCRHIKNCFSFSNIGGYCNSIAFSSRVH